MLGVVEMGLRALQAKKATERWIRRVPLSSEERERLRSVAIYEGSPHHKRNPGDFGLRPPVAPRPDKTLCDEAGILTRARADTLFRLALEHGLASEATTPAGLPKQLWIVDDNEQVFEAMHGGAREGTYHGYPIRRTDPLSNEVRRLWRSRP